MIYALFPRFDLSTGFDSKVCFLYLYFSVIIKIMKFFLLSVIFSFLATAYALAATNFFGQTQTTSDFTSAVQLGLQTLAANPAGQAQRQEIQDQDYKSAWDEFGINAFVDGIAPPSTITKVITRDIIQTIETEESYDREETKYLEDTQATPEEIKNIEESSGSDVPPGESIDPNPSIEANPEASIFAVEDQESSNAGVSTSSPDTVSSNLEISTSTPETSTSTPETSISNENTIFDAILQGEQTSEQSPASSSPDSNPSVLPAEAAPIPEGSPPAE